MREGVKNHGHAEQTYSRRYELGDAGYSNNNTKSSYTRAGNWTAANGGSGSKVEFIANGENSVRLQIQAAMICLNNVCCETLGVR